MRNITFFTIILIFTACSVFSQINPVYIVERDFAVKNKLNSSCDLKQIRDINGTDLQGKPLYYNDRIYLKVKTNVKLIGKTIDNPLGVEGKFFGIQSIDKLIQKYNIINLEHSFHLSPTLSAKASNRLLSTQAQLPDLSDIYTLYLPVGSNLQNVIYDFANDASVEYCEPVPMMYPQVVPDDSLYSQQQHLPQIHAEEAWDIFKGQNSDSTIIIGICDTGVDWTHPDLVGNLYQNLGEDANHNGHTIEFVNGKWQLDSGDINGIDDDHNGKVDDLIGWDFVKDYSTHTEGNDPMDYFGHGSHVAGLSAGMTNNGTGIASISWNVKFLPTSHSSPTFTNIDKGFEGIVYLAEMGADVINCSWGGGGYSSSDAAAIKYANSLGSILVIAAGNDNSPEHFYPACYPGVVSIASIAGNDKKAYYSNYGIGVDIGAPGGDYGVDGGILSTVLNGTYSRYQGTSMASPVAAGVFGLVKSFHPDWTSDRIIRQVLGSADDIDTLNPAYVNKLGTGRINAFRALTVPNADVPRQLRLELVRVIPDDSLSNKNGAIEPGENIRLGFIIRNYSPLVRADSVNFILSSDDPDITVVKGSYTSPIEADSNNIIPKLFEIQISPKAISRYMTLKLTTTCGDAQITYGSEMDFEIPVTAGGVLVWEGGAGNGYSGSFIRDFLSKQGVNVIYSNEFPASLNGFDAAFLSFGSQAGGALGNTGFDDWMADVVQKYLESGGKLYIEGTDNLGWDQRNNTHLLELFGLKGSDDGPDSNVLDSLQGNLNALTAVMVFKGTRLGTYRSADILFPGDGITAFTEPGYGVEAVQFDGYNYQKTFSSVYPVAGLLDANQPNTRYELIARIMNFFGYPIDYVVPSFSANPTTGHAPLKVKLSDLSYYNTPITNWDWDIDNSGIVESNQKNLDWTYTSPGIFNANLELSNGIRKYRTSQNIYVFDGESALDYSGSTGIAVIDSVPVLNLTKGFTIEAWIKPRQIGYFSRILDKGEFYISLISDRGNGLNFYSYNEDTTYNDCSTPHNSIVLNQWQHIAVTYNGDSAIKVYINGQDTQLTFNKTAKANILDNKSDMVYVGNNEYRQRPFAGTIDELRIWNVIRTQSDILSTMNHHLTGNENNLVGYWRFQEGNGPITVDESIFHDTCRVFADWREGWHEGILLSEPTDLVTCSGFSMVFSVQAFDNNQTLSYRWFKDSQELNDDTHFTGTKNDTLVINHVLDSDSGYYFVVVKAMTTGDTITSNKARLFVKNQINITQNLPANISLKEGQYLNFNVTATGTGTLIYQWFKDYFPIFGATSSSYTRAIKSFVDGGRYWCTIINDCGNVTSDTTLVSVIASVPGKALEKAITLNVEPNPFTNDFDVAFNLNETTQVILSLVDIFGNNIITIVNDRLPAGENKIHVNGKDLNISNSIYFCILKTKSITIVSPVIRY